MEGGRAEDSADSGPLKRTLHLALEDMHLRFEVALFRTFIRVVSLPGGEAYTHAHIDVYTHWPTRYVLAPSEIVSRYSRQTLDPLLSLSLSLPFRDPDLFLNFKLISCFPVVFVRLRPVICASLLNLLLPVTQIY